MKLRQILSEKQTTKAPKPRNFVAKNAMKTTSGAGKHKDKKRAAKQGEVKHKGKDIEEGIGGMIAGGVGQFIGNKIDPLAGEIMRAHGEIAGRKAEYTIRKYMHLLQKALKQQLDSGEKEGVAEDSLDEVSLDLAKRARDKAEYFVDMDYDDMRDRPYGYSEKQRRKFQRYIDRKEPRAKGDRDWDPPNKGVAEASDWGEPREILENVLQTLEREVEWPLTEVMDPKEVKQLLSPLVRAVNDKMMSMEESQDDWGSMSHREFKRKELQHELGHEDDPEFQRQMREKDRGPWYIKIDGKIYRQKGEPKVFDWKKAANNYALAMLKNKPELKSKTVLTRKPVDEMRETATAGATSAGNVAVGAVYKNKKGRTYKNPDGTAKNALDIKGANLLTGGSIKR